MHAGPQASKDAPEGFPSEMYFVMIMNPIVRKSVSKGMMIVVIVIVICIVGSLKLLERRKKKHGSDSSRTNSRRERKSLLIDIDCDCL